MAIDINYSPEQFDGISGNNDYQWWCIACQAYHYDSICPKYVNQDADVKIFINNIRYEFCPQCGQLIKREA